MIELTDEKYFSGGMNKNVYEISISIEYKLPQIIQKQTLPVRETENNHQPDSSIKPTYSIQKQALTASKEEVD